MNNFTVTEGSLVSIIIPVFNVKDHLRNALDSVVNQSYKNLEIIVIDDGSTDGSDIICDEYAKNDERILVVHQNNCGLSSSRNKGLDLMHGETVCFLDSDDSYHANYINDMLKVMSTTQAEIVMCRYSILLPSGKTARIGKKEYLPLIDAGIYSKKDALCALLNNTINISMWNKLYKRELWNNIRFPDGQVYEDINTTYKLIDQCNNVYVINSTLYEHTKRHGSITDTVSKKHIKDKITAFSEFVKFIKEHTPDIFSQEQLISYYHYMIKVLLKDYIYICQDNREKSQVFAEKLRKKIIILVNQYGLGKSDLKSRIAYYLLYSHPGILKVIFGIYHPLRMHILNLTGR